MSRRAVSMPCAAVGAVVGSVSAMLFLSAAAAGAAKAQELDGELLACCAEGIDADDRSDAILDVVDDMLPSDPRWEPMLAESRLVMRPYHAAVGRAAELPARTPEGLRAKAALALRELSSMRDDLPLVASLLRDVVGRAR